MSKFNCLRHGAVDSFKSVALGSSFCPKCSAEEDTPERAQKVKKIDALLARTDTTLAYTNKVLDRLGR